MEIIPAILTKDPFELDKLLRQIRDAKKFERVQVDFIDGQFAYNETIHPSQSDLIPYLPLKFDAHLMVNGDNNLFWGKECQAMGFERVYHQIESLSDQPDKYEYLAIDLPTEDLEQHKKKLSQAKGVILLAVKAGFQNQKFDDLVYAKIDWLRNLGKFTICIDGGVEKEQLEKLTSLGVNEVAVGVSRVLSWT
jgi:pentose-5-phosphate-3-epimerase